MHRASNARVRVLQSSTAGDPRQAKQRKGLAHWPDLGRLSERTLGGSSPPATCAAQAT